MTTSTKSRYTPPGTRPKDKKGDRNRRRRAHTLLNSFKIRSFCKGQGVTPWAVKSVFHTLMEFSSDYAKPSFGHQETFAREMECSVRHLQRCIKVLEAIGVLTVVRSKPERMPDGRVARPKVNEYHFTVPKSKPNRQKPCSRRHDSSDVNKPHPTGVYKTLGENDYENSIRSRVNAAIEEAERQRALAVPADQAKSLIADARKALGRG